MQVQPVDFEGKKAFLSVYVKRSIEKEFQFLISDLHDFKSRYNAKDFAKALLVAAIQLSESENYPYWFYYKRLQEKKSVLKVRRGKLDDITIVVGLVVKDKNEFDSKLEKLEWLRKIQDNKISLYKELDLDVESFVSNFDDDDYNPSDYESRPIEGKPQGIKI